MSKNIGSAPDSKESTQEHNVPGNPTSTPEKVVPDDIKWLRGMTGILILFWLIVLVSLSWIGLRATASDVNRYYEKSTSIPVPNGSIPAASPSPALSLAARPTGSPTVSPAALVAASPEASLTASPIAETSPHGSPTASPEQGDTVQSKASPGATATLTTGKNPSPIVDSAGSANPNQTPTPPTPEAARFASRQHFLTLAVLTATMVLFPWVLLLAFAFQSAPRIYRDLESDLKALGIYRPPEKIQLSEQDRLSLEKELEEKIRAGFKPNQASESEKASPGGLARSLASMAYLEGTGVGTQPPEQVEPSVWNSVQQTVRNVHERNAKTVERSRTGLTQRFGWMEFLLPLLSLTPIVLVSFVWAFWPEASFGFVNSMVRSGSLKDYFADVVVNMSPAAVGVITAYLFMMFGLVRRYHRSDITPGAYWEVLNRLIVVFLLGLVGTVVLVQGINNGATRTAAIMLGILAGVFPIGTLEAIAKLAESRLQQSLAGQKFRQDVSLSRRLQQQHPLSMLDDLDAWDELRLTEEGVIGIQGMATADIAHLLVWTPFTTHQIVDWVDQSILFLAAGAEPDAQYVRTFRKLGLRGVSDLLDATRTEVDRKRVVGAAEAIQKAVPKGTPKEAGAALIAAQQAVSEVQAKVKDAQEQVGQVKDKKKDDPLDKNLVTSALMAIENARKSIDAAVESVKAGGANLAAAQEAANSLQSKFKAGGEKAGNVRTALAAANETVTEDLEAALKALGNELTAEPDANSQAAALRDALNKLAKPVSQTELAASQFAEKAAAIQKKAEATQTDVPSEVDEAESLFNSLSKLAQETQQSLKSDGAADEATSNMDGLVELVTDESPDKPKQLITELKKKEEWTTAGDDTKAKSYRNAEKLVGQAAEMLKHARAAATATQVVLAEIETEVVISLPLTMNVLVTLLHGLERNPNLRRILRYLTSEVRDVQAPGHYMPNNEWLGASGVVVLPPGGIKSTGTIPWTTSGTGLGTGPGTGPGTSPPEGPLTSPPTGAGPSSGKG